MCLWTTSAAVRGLGDDSPMDEVDESACLGGYWHAMADVEFGPFGSTCRASAADVPDIVAAVTEAALAHGATHVHLHVAAVEAS